MNGNMETALNGDVYDVVVSGCFWFRQATEEYLLWVGAAFGRNNIPNGVWLR